MIGMKHNSNHRTEWSRRQLLLSGVLGGSALLAGCIGDEDPEGTPGDDDHDPIDLDDLDGVHVEGQQLRMPIPQNPDEMHFAWDIGRGVDTELVEARHSVYPAVHTTPIWADWLGPYQATPENRGHFQLYEDVEITENTITVTIRDDANWSDGNPVRAYDAVAQRAYWAEPHEEYGYAPPPGSMHIVGSSMGFTMPDGPDGKTYQFHVIDTPEWEEAGGFHMDYGGVLFWIGWTFTRLGPMWPSHVEPFKSLAEEAVADFEAQNLDALGMFELSEKYVSEEDLHELRENPPPTHGAWKIDEVVGTQEVVLTPNEHHFNADKINFDEVVLEYSAEPSRTRNAILSGHLDFATVDAPPETIEAFPDTIEEYPTPAGGGYVIALNHDSPFGDVRVRQAIMYALETPDIAQNVHPTATEPIVTPGWDTWASDAVLDGEWASENLLSYEQDLDKAAELMTAAGYERGDDGVWENDDGPIQAQLATPTETPAWETTVQSQLAEFGINIDVRSLDETSYVDRWTGLELNERVEEGEGRGDFEMWAGDWASDMPAGFYNGLQTHWWAGQARTFQLRARNYFPHDAQEDAATQYDDGGAVSGNYEAWKELFIELPPIGEPDGDPEPINILYTAGRVNNGPLDPEDPQLDNEFYNPPHDEPHPENAEYYWQMLAWSHNYWLPVLPLALNMQQNFLNTGNFIWARDLPGSDNEAMWEHFGGNWDAANLAGMGKIVADPENPKPGAEVVDR